MIGAIAELAQLSPMEYDRARKAKAKELGVRPATLDAEVKKARQENDATTIQFVEPEPWPQSVDGGVLLDTVRAFILRYVAITDAGAVAASLWVILSWLHPTLAIHISPILAVTSPQKRCGKTTLLRALSLLVRYSLPTSNVTVAALFRAVDKYQPTLLIDEADTFLHENDELRGILNSGHVRESAGVIRTVGDDHEPRQFSTWSAKAIALIGNLSDTLEDRSILIALQRRKAGEPIERLRAVDVADHAEQIKSMCARWADDHAASVGGWEPYLPSELHDRAIDNWEPLLAIAEVAKDKEWVKAAREAALKLSGGGDDNDDAGVALLADIREVFAGNDAMFSKDLAADLACLDDRPWARWHKGNPISTNAIARLLKPFKIGPTTIRDNQNVAKGYKSEFFADAWERYLKKENSPYAPETTVTPLQRSNHAGFSGKTNVTTETGVTVENRRKPAPVLDCNGVTNESGGNGGLRNFYEPGADG